MFLLRRPSSTHVEQFLRGCRDLPLSYGPPGILDTNVRRGRRDEIVVPIGKGAAEFASGRRALMDWTHFDLGWIELFPDQGVIRRGAVVAVLIRHLGFWSLNGCRIIAVSESDPARFGFTYGTLPNHCE